MQAELINPEPINPTITLRLDNGDNLQPWPEHWRGLEQEFNWFKKVLSRRIESYFNEQQFDFVNVPPPQLSANCHYSARVSEHQLNPQQRLLLILAWTAEFAADELDLLQTRNQMYDLPYAEFGGLHNHNQPGFKPTLQTALFLLAGVDRVAALMAQQSFAASDWLFAQNILFWDESESTGANIHRPLQLTAQTRLELLHGQSRLAGQRPKFSAQFPAKELTTQFSWADLILPPGTQSHLNELQLWLQHGDTLRQEWNMAKALSPGYKALFYGPPGTGKTLTAALLGKTLNQPVYRIDLSQVVSKYIGETEKNLERIFQTAESQDWILFFDEADALFGKRTQVSSSNDRHANMETGYLLQRIEACSNLVILASNLKDNIDEAFLRRFQSIILFDNPGPNERLKLWQQGFSKKADLSDIDCGQLAQQYELSGAEINNVIRYASLMALEHHDGKINQLDVVTAIRREKYKSGQFV